MVASGRGFGTDFLRCAQDQLTCTEELSIIIHYNDFRASLKKLMPDQNPDAGMRSSNPPKTYREPVQVVEAGSLDGDETRLGADGVSFAIRTNE